MRRPLIIPKEHKDVDKYKFNVVSKIIIILLSIILIPLAWCTILPYFFGKIVNIILLVIS